MLPADLRRALRRVGGSGRTGTSPRGQGAGRRATIEAPDAFLDALPVLFPRGEGNHLAGMLGGREMLSPDAGAYWLIELPLAEVWPESARRLASLHTLLSGEPVGVPKGLEHAFATGAGSLLFLDIETGGLSGCPVFLIGCLALRDSQPLLCFFLARDLDEERPLLRALALFWRGYECLVTFNGRSFDVPFIHDRMTYYRVKGKHSGHHVDLLHVFRRVLKGDVPNHRLQTLERHYLNRRREDDLPGAEVPGMFYRFFETRDPALLASILQHNALDLVTLGELLVTYLERL